VATYTYPSAAELREIEQDLIPTLTQDDPIFQFFPFEEVNADVLLWEQRDNYRGLQQIRGMNGEPTYVKPVGLKRYRMVPGVYGEFMDCDEEEMTRRAAPGSFTDFITIDDLVMERQQQLLLRRVQRVKLIAWTLIATGTFSVSAIAPTPAIVMQTDTYTLQTFTASPVWATSATATPLADFRAVQLLARGHSVDFGQAAVAYMNQATFNSFISNTNTSDLFGRRTAGLGTFNNITQTNELLAGDNLPRIVVYDGGYLDNSGTFQLFIPNNKVVVVGKRPAGQPVGAYRFTRNVNNLETGVGPYTRVVDHGPLKIPRKIEVHDGHNGGPVLYFPSAVVVMTV
jgi:hypothetical protein